MLFDSTVFTTKEISPSNRPVKSPRIDSPASLDEDDEAVTEPADFITRGRGRHRMGSAYNARKSAWAVLRKRQQPPLGASGHRRPRQNQQSSSPAAEKKVPTTVDPCLRPPPLLLAIPLFSKSPEGRPIGRLLASGEFIAGMAAMPLSGPSGEGMEHSVAQTVTLTSLAFFLSSGLYTVSGAPAFGLRTAISTNPNNMEPWLQPCGTPVAAAFKRMPQRHSVHRALKRVRTQLRVAQNHFRKDLKDVQKIYSKVYKVLKEQYRMDWLPEKQLEWYRREVWCLEKGKKAERALPRLHDSLQRFAITFYHLRAFHLKSNINADRTMNRRNEIIDGMHNEILRMLCEVETAILNLGLQVPTTHTALIVTESSNWAKEGDLTLMLIQDWGVLRLYQTFLNDWTRAFRNATATGPGTCDPNMIRPLSFRSKHGKAGPKGKKMPKSKKQGGAGRKHPPGGEQDSSLAQAQRKGAPRNRPLRKKPKA
ncbi:hypothetical protein KM043_006567 [Ampulex compressa]|nr:hypothetical protein KM043_006567 [Ampulex compressa]